MISTQTTMPDDPASWPHWEAAARGVLSVQRCTQCGTHRFPAASTCKQCHGRGVEWVTLSGHGHIETFCVFHKAYWTVLKTQVPYTVMQIMLDEGVRYMSSLSGDVSADIAIGQRVKAWFDPVSDKLTLVRFLPVLGASA